MRLGTYLRAARLLLSKRAVLPEYVTFFVTARCNLRCAHCFYWKSLNAGEGELGLHEIETLSRRMHRFHSLLLTGGEPFQRADIAEIAALFREHNQVEKISIATNGVWDEAMARRAEELVTRTAGCSLTVSVSIDGREALHDRIRRKRGAFARAIASFNALKALKRHHPHLSVATITTYTKYNQEHIDDIFDFVRDELQPDAMSFPLVRGDARRRDCKEISIAGYKRLLERLAEHYFTGGRAAAVKHFGSPFIAAAKLVSTEVNRATFERHEAQLPCLAGSVNAVIYEDGSVYPCELLDRKMGSLREADYDFERLWYSARARAVREWIGESGCYCHHGCNTITNVLFNRAYLTRVLRDGLRLAR